MAQKGAFEFNAGRGEFRIGSRIFRLPTRAPYRITLGVLLVLGGFLGFLPILGFWMLPLGLLILSQDLRVVRRWRRALVVKFMRRKTGTHAQRQSTEDS